MIHKRFSTSRTEFFVIMILFATRQKIKENTSIGWSMDVWRLNNVKFFSSQYANDYCLLTIWVWLLCWSCFFSRVNCFHIVYNWFKQFNKSYSSTLNQRRQSAIAAASATVLLISDGETLPSLNLWFHFEESSIFPASVFLAE